MLPTLFGVVAAAAIGTAAVIAVTDEPTEQAPATTPEPQVERVVDGDTIDVRIGDRTERIRLLNIDTPETVDPNESVQCLGPEAAAQLESLIPEGTAVRLEFDVERTDKYGRTLAAVFKLDGTLVNAEMARAGLAIPYGLGVNDRFLQPVKDAQQDAIAHERGLYSPAVSCTVPGRVRAATEPVASAQQASATAAVTAAADLEAAAGKAKTAFAAAMQVGDLFRGARAGLIWAAYSWSDLEQFHAPVADAVQQLERAESVLRTEIPKAKQREIAKADAERRAQATPPPSPDVSKPQPQQVPAPSTAPQPAPNPYPGYNGPRCYEPGGKVWHPCK